MGNDILVQNKKSWDAMADSWFGATALPAYGCFVPTEDDLGLFPPLRGKKVLDIGCGSGHSLHWCAEKGAAELWGLDISTRQIENAKRFLAENGHAPTLFNAPMEEDCGIPKDYFDVVYSIYAIGWTVDLPATLAHIASYLKKDGVFLFSWDHPLMYCVDVFEKGAAFAVSYFKEELFSYIQRGNPVTIKNRRMSTYINALADAGFAVERLIEETDAETLLKPAEFSTKYYTPYKAKLFPMSFIIKARKL